MANLNDLTVYYLEKLAKECNISIKKSSTKTEKIKLIKKETTQKIRRSSKKDLETRITNLEEQVKLLTSTLSELKKSRNRGETRELIEKVSNLDNVKRAIISMMVPGEALTIDELIGIKDIQQYPLSMITQAIIELIKEQALIGVKGNSIQKIGGKIGKLIRK